MSGLSEHVVSVPLAGGKHRPIKFTSWNCKGISTATSYLTDRILTDSSVVVLSEHWLWPYELYKLDEIHSNYKGHGLSDARLTEKANGGRGFGGVGILWHKNLDVTVIQGIDSDRICGIRIRTARGNILSIIGVYLPCGNAGIELYHQCLMELENVIVNSSKIGPTIIGGDFNAHLGFLGGPKGSGDPNIQGTLLDQFCKRNDLFAATLSTHASGPSYTYFSGSMKSTVDYILLDPQCSLLFENCLTHEDFLNVSDHLPQSVVVSIDLLVERSQCKESKKINWSGASESDSCIVAYQEEVRRILSPFLNKLYDTVEEIDKDISEVSSLLCKAAEFTLPIVQPKNKKCFHDTTLSKLSQDSKNAW